MWIELQREIDRLIERDKLPLVTKLQTGHDKECAVRQSGWTEQCNCNGTYHIIIKAG